MAVWDVRISRSDTDGKTLTTQITAEGYEIDPVDIKLAHFFDGDEYVATVRDYFYIKKLR